MGIITRKVIETYILAQKTKVITVIDDLNFKK